MVAEPLQYSSGFGHSFKMKISEISLYFNGLRFHLSILPKSNYLPLCCFTGLAFCDIKSLKRSDITTDADGNMWIRKHREKTGELSVIPLLDVPRRLIEKYSNHPKVMLGGVVLPVISNQRMNAYLKEVADLAKINRHLTSHIGRHTFATLSLSNHVPIESISKMLGHSDIRTTQIYAKMQEKTIYEDMASMRQKFDCVMMN